MSELHLEGCVKKKRHLTKTTQSKQGNQNNAPVRVPPERPEFRASVRIPELDVVVQVVRAAGQNVLRRMQRHTIHPAAEILRSQHLNNEL